MGVGLEIGPGIGPGIGSGGSGLGIGLGIGHDGGMAKELTKATVAGATTPALRRGRRSMEGSGAKSEETRARILETALRIFRERGFDGATMREIAVEAGVATGAAYYYFDSKDAIVMAFYARAQEAMRPEIEARMAKAKTLEARLRAVIDTKLEYFAPDRRLLTALSAHTDPEHPLSPFSAETEAIRAEDVARFRRAAEESGVKLPARIRGYLPRLLWMYQMGLIFYWVYDRSEGQRKTRVLYEKSLKMLLVTLKLAGFPLLRPLHGLAADLLDAVYGD